MTRDRDRQPRFMNKWITSHRYVYLQLRSDQVDKMVKLLEQYTMIIKNTHTRRHSHAYYTYVYLKMRCSYVDWITGDEAWVPTETIRLENGLWREMNRHYMRINVCMSPFFDLRWPRPKKLFVLIFENFVYTCKVYLLTAYYQRCTHTRFT